MKVLQVDSATKNSSGRLILLAADDFTILEAPTLWLEGVAKRHSKSRETFSKYSGIISRYLQWLDDVGYGCQSWAAVDQEIFEKYIEYLQAPRSEEKLVPLKDTVIDYACRIIDFYEWARRRGYRHYLEIEMQEVEFFVKDQFLLSHVFNSLTVRSPKLKIRPGPAELVASELNKFVTTNDYLEALKLLGDPVFVLMATIIRITAMRPKELLQIPYRGTGANAGFVPHDADAVPAEIEEKTINFFCESKGKNRCIKFPGKLWATICRYYIPIRRRRARLYMEREGVSPSNSVLFLTERGYAVTYGILYDNFSKVGKISAINRAEGKAAFYSKDKFCPRMLRHMCATYFVIDALRLKNRLGKAYVYDASIDEDLRELLGHEKVETTYKHYVHLINRLMSDDLLSELHKTRIDEGLSVMLDKLIPGLQTR